VGYSPAMANTSQIQNTILIQIDQPRFSPTFQDNVTMDFRPQDSQSALTNKKSINLSGEKSIHK
jgi:hypothetical protein